MTDAHKSTRLGDLLVERGVITRLQLAHAVELQQARRLQALQDNAPDSYKQELGEVLIELGFIDRSQLKMGLGWQRRIRKTTAVMVFIAPLLTAACGGGGGAGSGGAVGSNNVQAVTPSSQTVSSEPVTDKPVGKPAVPSSTASTQTVDNVHPVYSSNSSSAPSISSAPTVSNNSSSSNKSSAIVSPAASSIPGSSAVSSTSFSRSSVPGSSVSSTPKSSSSSSSVAPVSSSSVSSSTEINGPVQVYWTPPSQRENGDFLDITELGGYELRYKRKTDIRFTSVIINDSYTDAYYFDYLEGEYEFQIAVFDTKGVYSVFVPVNPM